jgi:hypothetical protein
VITPQVLVPTLLVPLIAWRLYKRVRNTFGLQPIHTNRIIVRLAILAAVGTAMLIISFHSMSVFTGAVGGLLIGSALAVLGLRLTKWHNEADGLHYEPNPYLGIALTMLLVGRLIYRLMIVVPAAQAPLAPNADPFASLHQSPFTLGIVMLTIGYYLIYSAGVLWESRRRAVPAATATTATATTPVE